MVLNCSLFLEKSKPSSGIWAGALVLAIIFTLQGVSILKSHFNDEVEPMGILPGALVPTAFVLLLFILL